MLTTQEGFLLVQIREPKTEIPKKTRAGRELEEKLQSKSSLGKGDLGKVVVSKNLVPSAVVNLRPFKVIKKFHQATEGGENQVLPASSPAVLGALLESVAKDKTLNTLHHCKRKTNRLSSYGLATPQLPGH